MGSRKMSFLLDTNHCVYLNNAKNKQAAECKNFEQNTLTHFNGASEPLFVSEVTLGEMYFGVAKSQEKLKNYA
jgi:predicted nucleic acid-binding protein